MLDSWLSICPSVSLSLSLSLCLSECLSDCLWWWDTLSFSVSLTCFWSTEWVKFLKPTGNPKLETTTQTSCDPRVCVCVSTDLLFKQHLHSHTATIRQTYREGRMEDSGKAEYVIGRAHEGEMKRGRENCLSVQERNSSQKNGGSLCWSPAVIQ